MEHRTYNIKGADPVILISGAENSNEVVTVDNCIISNTYSSDITISLYLEVAPADSTSFYIVKSLVIPIGVSLALFEDHPKSYRKVFALKVVLEASETADITLSYDEEKVLTNENDTAVGKRLKDRSY
tara:strand:+ start:320 stop:703 length:384 start_codon:yes stop_codon:yes gene_type:complete